MELIEALRISTPLGTMLACANSHGICLLEFEDQKNLQRHLDSLQVNLKTKLGNTSKNPHLLQLQRELQEYFNGKRQHFSVALSPQGTPFQQKAWRALQTIPYGQTQTYKQQTSQMDMDKGFRAVANANGQNRIAIVIPCHRVVGQKGTLTGYAGGVDRKATLLNLEAS